MQLTMEFTERHYPCCNICFIVYILSVHTSMSNTFVYYKMMRIRIKFLKKFKKLNVNLWEIFEIAVSRTIALFNGFQIKYPDYEYLETLRLILINFFDTVKKAGLYLSL